MLVNNWIWTFSWTQIHWFVIFAGPIGPQGPPGIEGQPGINGQKGKVLVS